MNDLIQCPNDERWQAMLRGELGAAEQAELEEHLESCGACVSRLEAIVGEAEIPAERLQQLGEKSPADGPISMIIANLASKNSELTQQMSDTRITPGYLNFLTPSNDPAQLGKLGEYEILEVIGRGGMGIVLKARDPRLNRIAAIKVLGSELAGSAVARQRFRREAQSAAAVVNDHVVTIHAVDEAHEIPFMVMEYVVGVSLSDRLERSGQLKLHEILRIGMQTALGLAAAHAQGLVHRDVKPGNILLENGVERVKLTDFGLAMVLDDAQITQTNTIKGTPQYMSPEQANGEEVDQRTDLFSLGCVLYAMCTGRSPFRAKTPAAALKRVCEDTPRPVSEVNAEIPDWLVAVIQRLLEKNPDDRFQSAAEVARLLEDYLAHVQQPGKVPLPSGHEAWKKRRSRPASPAWKWAAAAVVVCMVALLIGLYGRPFLSPTTRDATSGKSVDPPGPFHFVSLQEQANIGLADAGADVLRDLKPGILKVGDVPLNVEQRFIQLSGKEASQFPEEVAGIVVGRPASKVHFLHATRSCPTHYRPVGQYVFSYEDGTSETMPLVSTRNIKDWRGDLSGETLGHTDLGILTEGVCAWTGPIRAGTKKIPRLFLTTWENPHAKKKIASIAFERGPLASPAPFCLAITCDDDPSPLNRTGVLGALMDEPGIELRIEGPESLTLGRGKHLKHIQPGVYEATVVEDGREARQGQLRIVSGEFTWFRASPLLDRIQRASPQPAVEIMSRQYFPLGHALSSDKTLLATSADDGSISLWSREHEGFKLVRNVFAHDTTYQMPLVFSADGTMLISGGNDGAIRLWAADTLDLLHTLREKGPDVKCLAVSPNSETLVAGTRDGTVEVWNLTDQTMRRQFPAHVGTVHCITYSPDGRFVATGESQMNSLEYPYADADESYLKVWDADTFELKWDLKGHTSSVQALRFTPDGSTLASASDDTTVRLWSMENGRQQRVLFGVGRHQSLAFSPDASLVVSGAMQKTTCIWETKTGILLNEFFADWCFGINSVDFLDETKLISTGRDSFIRIWDVTKLPKVELPTEPLPKPLNVFNVGHNIVTCLAASGDGQRLAAATVTTHGNVWNLRTGRKLALHSQLPIGGNTIQPKCVAFLPNGDLLTRSSGNGFLRRWISDSFHHEDMLSELSGGYFGLSPDGRVAAITDWSKRTLDLIDVKTGKMRSGPRLSAYGDPMGPVFSPDQASIVIPTRQGHIVLISTESLKVKEQFRLDKGAPIVSFSPEGDILLVATDTVKLLNVSTLDEVAEFQGNETGVAAAAFSPDGKFIVAGLGCRNLYEKEIWRFTGEICIWDRESRQLLTKFPAHGVTVSGIAFTPDGKQLLSCGFDGRVYVWDFQELLKYGRTDREAVAGILAIP